MGQNTAGPIRVWASHMSIRIWDVPCAYGPIYAYGAEHIYAISTASILYTSKTLKAACNKQSV